MGAPVGAVIPEQAEVLGVENRHAGGQGNHQRGWLELVRARPPLDEERGRLFEVDPVLLGLEQLIGDVRRLARRVGNVCRRRCGAVLPEGLRRPLRARLRAPSTAL